MRTKSKIATTFFVAHFLIKYLLWFHLWPLVRCCIDVVMLSAMVAELKFLGVDLFRPELLPNIILHKNNSKNTIYLKLSV